MPKTIETFILGNGNAPDWLKDAMSNGTVQKSENEEGVSYVIHTPNGVKVAHDNDVVVRIATGVSLVPADKAEKYRMVRKPQKVEAKEGKE